MATRTLEIVIAGDARGAVRAFTATDKAAGKTERGVKGKLLSLGQSFKRLGVAAAAGLVGVGFLAVKVGGDLVAAAEESQKVTKQTNAVLKSTGAVANVTAKQVADLATQLSLKSGVDDELIQSGANVLLTFTKVRDEVGKGNDIFTQATAVALDMSAALGQDMQSSVIQLGKALNDPIRGITALRRVGVTFSEDQVKMIKRLVETGDLLGAQKVILQELTTEFGGSAAAQATASDKLRVAWGNLQEELGKRLLPWVEKFSDWMIDKGIPLVQSFADWIEQSLIPALGDIKVWVEKNVVPPLQSMWRVFHDDILPVLEDIVSFIGDEVIPKFKDLAQAISGTNEEAKNGGPSLAGWAIAIGTVAAAVGIVAAAIAPVIGLLKVLGTAFGFLGFAATTAFGIILRTLPFAHIAGIVLIFRRNILDWLGTAWRSIRDFFTQGGRYIAEQWRQRWNQITATLQAWWRVTSDFFVKLPGRLASYFKTASKWLYEGGKNILRGMWKGIKDVWNDVVDWFKDLPGNILDILGIASPPKWAIDAGRWIMKGIAKGAGLGVGSVMDFMSKLAGGFTGALAKAWSGLTEGEPGWAFGILAQGFESVLALGRQMAAAFGWTGAQWDALQQLWHHESGWNPSALNQSSGAYGIPQSLPASKMGAAAQASNRDIMSRAAAQIAWGLSYIRDRYGSPANAWSAWQSRSPHWYGGGGVVSGPVGAAVPATVHGGEGIFTPTQMRHLSINGRGGAATIVNVTVHGSVMSEKDLVATINRQLSRGTINKNGRAL